MGAGVAAAAVKNKNLTIRTNAEEYGKIKEFARFQGKTVSSLVMDAIWEKIEDWEDLRAIDEYLKNPNHDLMSHEDFMKELGLR